jgi:hypothetical protein
MAPGGALHRLCFSFLGKHAVGKCEAKKQCGMSGCTKFHHPMLHKNNIVINTMKVIDENKSQVILQIVPVKIRGKKMIETYGFM